MSYGRAQRTTVELLGDWAAVMREFCRRDVVWTNNNPVEDISPRRSLRPVLVVRSLSLRRRR
jgi:hypothetical protein